MDNNQTESRPTEDGNKRQSNLRRILPQFLAGTAKNLLLFDLGVVLGFQTIIIGNLLNEPTQPSFTDDESSWFASLLFIGQPIGCLFAAICLEPLGRKKSMIALNIPLFLGWVIISTAQSVPLLYTGSVIFGLGLGFMEAPTLTYIGEISEPAVRGIMTSYAELVVGLGTIVVYSLGVWNDWRTVAYICTALPVLSSIAIACIPESPIWLLAHNRTEEAEKALCWLRGWVSPEMIREEFSELVSYKNNTIFNGTLLQSEGHLSQTSISGEASVNKYGSVGDKQETNTETNKSTFQDHLTVENKTNVNLSCESNVLKKVISDLLEPNMVRALFLISGFFFFNAAAGANAVTAYAVPVFQELGFTVDPFRANVASAVAATLGQLTLMALVYCLGKRKIVLFSILGCAVGSFAIGIFALHPNTVSTDSYWSIPFILFIVNNYIYGLGLGTIPWMYLSEVFPFRGRGAATGIAASVNYMFGFCVTKSFFMIKNAITLAGLFFFYGVISVIGFVYLYFLLPETEGRTLQEIEESGRK